MRVSIPHQDLPTQTLEAVVSEFVSRDGTDHTSVDSRIAEVIKLLEDGRAEIQFDTATETCSISQLS